MIAQKIKKCKKDLAQQHEKMEKCTKCHKLETVKEHGKLEENDNVVRPLKMTKELTCVLTEVKCFLITHSGNHERLNSLSAGKFKGP